MAALSITATGVKKVAGSTRTGRGLAGATLTAGQALYGPDSALLAAINDTAPHAIVVGIALNGGAIGQTIEYAIPDGGLIDLGATIAVGKPYCLGVAGGIIPVDDIVGAEFISMLGVGIAANRFMFKTILSGVAAAGAVA